MGLKVKNRFQLNHFAQIILATDSTDNYDYQCERVLPGINDIVMLVEQLNDVPFDAKKSAAVCRSLRDFSSLHACFTCWFMARHLSQI